MSNPHLHVFAYGEHILTSVDFPILPLLPPVISLDGENWEPFQAMQLQWATSSFPQIAFVPRHPDFNNSLFKCLNCAFSIEPINNKWQLARDTQDAWSHLEESLKMAGSILIAGHMLPLDWAWFPLPQTFGYKRPHRTRRIAAKCADTSRQAFIQLAAMCSLAVAMNFKDGDFNSPYPRWVQILRAGGMHAVWVDNFRSSQFADFIVTERVGSIVRPGCQWLHLVPTMRLAKVPLLFFWEHGNQGSYAKAIMGHKIREFCPSENQIEVARTVLVREEPPVESIDSFTEQGPASEPPPPERYSGQERGETWQEFFERQRTSHEALMKVENVQRRMARESRHRTEMQNNMPPGNRGAVVWVWTDVDGFLIRKRVPRSQVRDVWADFAHTQRRYNSFTHSWDLCWDFDLEAKRDENEDSEDDDVELFPSIALTRVSADNFLPSPAVVRQWSSSAINDIFESEDFREDEQRFTYQEEPLDDLLFHHYGFHSTSSIHGKHISDPEASKFTMKTLAVSENNWSSLVSDRAQVISFVQDLKSGIDPPESLWDLSNTSDVALVQQTDYDVVIFSYHTRSGTHYVIEPRVPPSEGDATWRIVVRSATTALKCLRHRWGQSRYSLARELLIRGIAFSTMEPLRSPPVGASLRPSYEHAPREVGYKPDQHDYRQYEGRLTEFFHNEAHARAAFLRGGLLWRLAREVLGITMDDYVLLGPSAGVHAVGTYIKLSPQGPEIWDDGLTEVELNFICGVIPILTGNKDQTQEPSWWPKIPLFEKSPLNVGYWSHSCEHWFSQRIEKIRSGEEVAKTSARWKKSLKLWQPTLALTVRNEAAASYFLTSCCNPFPER